MTLFVVVQVVLAELWGTQPARGALLQFAATTSAGKVSWSVKRAIELWTYSRTSNEGCCYLIPIWRLNEVPLLGSSLTEIGH